MKIFLILIVALLFISFSSYAQIYVSPTGSDSNTGSIDKPYKTISKGVSAAVEGDTIYLRSGVYSSSSKLNLSKIGNSDNYYNLWAYPGEKPVLDFTGTSSDGMSISGKYWHVKGLEIMNATHNGINISGSYNIIENCQIHNNKNTGVQMGSSSSTADPSHNLILNCDSYFNFDPPIGGNADGFGAKWNIGKSNIYKGCRAYNNSDDGWDFWMADSSIEIDSFLAFRNGVDIWHTGQVSGNGNGFKLGGSYIPTPHLVENCVSFDNAGNTGRGFDENNNTAGQTIYNCTSYRNKGDNFHFNNTVVSGEHDIKNCISFDGNVSITSGVQQNNSWQGFTVSASDFLSTDTSLAVAPRNEDGSLQVNNFFRLASGSSLIDAGVDVGLPFSSIAPDLGAYESSTATNIIDSKNQSSINFRLFQNYPNPFNPSTKIKFSLTKQSFISLIIYNLLGKKVTTLVSQNLSPGEHEIIFDARDLPSGLYFYKLKSADLTITKKMLLIK